MPVLAKWSSSVLAMTVGRGACGREGVVFFEVDHPEVQLDKRHGSRPVARNTSALI